MKTATNWEQLIMRTVMAGKAKEPDGYKDKGGKEEEDPDVTMEEDNFEENSTIILGKDKGKFEDIEIKFE
jgi:hypothetical protein